MRGSRRRPHPHRPSPEGKWGEPVARWFAVAYRQCNPHCDSGDSLTTFVGLSLAARSARARASSNGCKDTTHGDSHQTAARGTQGTGLFPDRGGGLALAPGRALCRDPRSLQSTRQAGADPSGSRQGAGVDGEGGDAHRYRPLPAEAGRSARQTPRIVGRLRKPHGEQGEVAVQPLVQNPGAVVAAQARLYVVDEDRRVIAGPLTVARRRAYHREWLLGLAGVTREAAEAGRERCAALDRAPGGM